MLLLYVWLVGIVATGWAITHGVGCWLAGWLAGWLWLAGQYYTHTHINNRPQNITNRIIE